MNNKLLKVLNPLLLIAFIVVGVAVALYKIPGELQGTEQMGKLHELAGIAFLALAVLHIILNWKWIKTQIFGIKNKSVKKTQQKKK